MFRSDRWRCHRRHRHRCYCRCVLKLFKSFSLTFLLCAACSLFHLKVYLFGKLSLTKRTQLIKISHFSFVRNNENCIFYNLLYGRLYDGWIDCNVPIVRKLCYFFFTFSFGLFAAIVFSREHFNSFCWCSILIWMHANTQKVLAIENRRPNIIFFEIINNFFWTKSFQCHCLWELRVSCGILFLFFLRKMAKSSCTWLIIRFFCANILLNFKLDFCVWNRLQYRDSYYNFAYFILFEKKNIPCDFGEWTENFLENRLAPK